MDPVNVTLEQEKVTKNTIRYKENVAQGGEPVVGVIYVPKATLGAEPPKKLNVTITAG